MGSVLGWLLKSRLGQALLLWLLKPLWESFFKAVLDWVERLKRRFVNKSNAEKYKDAILDPNATDEEVIKDGQDLLNGDRP